MSNQNLAAFLVEVAEKLGKDSTNQAEETLRRYGENTLPGGDVVPSAVVYPSNTQDVQAVVRAANKHGVQLYPVSTGNNIGLGSRSPVGAGQVVVDLGRKMNKILEINDTLAYAVVEPGVSYQMMYDELVRRGNKLMLDVTSGPPHGGMLGNALDKGAGYTPYFDHFGMSCGLEIVLPNGEILRTGDGSLATDTPSNWHTSKYSFGPMLDGLFAQSNYGIVTRMGFWLMPRPPAFTTFHVAYENDDDLEEIVELCRPLKLSNFVPSLLRVANDLYLCATEGVSAEYRQSGGKKSISNEGRRALAKKYGVGSWVVSGAFYGANDAAMAPMIDRVRNHFGASGKGRFISHQEALETPPLQIAINALSGVPSAMELGMLKWRPGGGNSWFLPGTPMIGKVANEFQHLCRGIYEKYGLDYTVMNVCSARFCRGLHVLTFNREDLNERQRAYDCYKEMAIEVAKRGVFVGRSPTDFQEFHMSQALPVFRDTCSAIKQALDPNGIIAPGKYGIS